MRAPVAPMGWPRAMAPPLTLSFSGSKCSSRSQARTWAAKASLTSTRSKSSRRSRVFSSSRRTAGTTPMPITCGIDAGGGDARARAPSAATPARRRDRRHSTTRAAAPSVMPDELPGGDRALRFLEHRGQLGQGGRRRCRRADARPATPRSRRSVPGTFTGTTSARKRPSSQARAARCWLRRANASCSSRGIRYCAASVSAVSPMSCSASGHRKPSWYIPSTAVWSPMR